MSSVFMSIDKEEDESYLCPAARFLEKQAPFLDTPHTVCQTGVETIKIPRTVSPDENNKFIQIL